MGDYKDDMSGEKKPSGLFPEGQRVVRVLEMMESKSKAGNRMFQTVIEDIKTKTNMTIFLVAEPKKRWMLKSLLSAVSAPAATDGVYDWSTADVIGHTVTAIVEHYTEPWINREGNEVTSTKSKVTEFLPATQTEEEVVWSEQ